MAVDTFVAYVAVYDNAAGADADYEAVKELHAKAGLIDAYDAAVIERRADGKVKITKNTRRRPAAACSAAGRGWPPAGGGPVPVRRGRRGPARGRHRGRRGAGRGGRSRSGRDEPQGSKELGEHLDVGQAGLVVVAVSDSGAEIERAMKQARKIEARQ